MKANLNIQLTTVDDKDANIVSKDKCMPIIEKRNTLKAVAKFLRSNTIVLRVADNNYPIGAALTTNV